MCFPLERVQHGIFFLFYIIIIHSLCTELYSMCVSLSLSLSLLLICVLFFYIESHKDTRRRLLQMLYMCLLIVFFLSLSTFFSSGPLISFGSCLSSLIQYVHTYVRNIKNATGRKEMYLKELFFKC